MNTLVNSELFAKNITDYDTEFSHLLLNLLAKIIEEMSNGLGETKIGNVLYRYLYIQKNNRNYYRLIIFFVTLDWISMIITGIN